MKKRIFSLFLAAVLLLSGCAVEGDPKDTQASAVPSTAGTTEPVDYWQNVKDRVQQGTVYEPAEPLIEYDPDRQLLITLANQSINFFTSGMKGNTAAFDIFSREPLTEDDIQFQIPCQTEYEIMILDYSKGNAKDADRSDMGYNDLPYLLYTGVDFGEYKQWQPFAAAALELSLESLSDKKQEDWEAYQQIYKECETKWNEELGKLNLITSDNFPEKPIYRYHIRIIFPGLDGKYYDETVETIDVLIQGERHTVDVGQWRFYSQIPDDLSAGMEAAWENGMRTRIVGREDPYNGGYVACREAFLFVAEEDMSILGLRQVFGGEDLLNVLGARVSVTGSQVIDSFWDLEQPLDIRKGDKVRIDLYFQDELFEEYLFSVHSIFQLECKIRQTDYSVVSFINFVNSLLTQWGPYLIAFEGVDLSNYCYWNQSIPDDLEPMPEEWRK